MLTGKTEKDLSTSQAGTPALPAVHPATQALWHIADAGNTHRVESILADGADINASNEHGMTALMRAASHGDIEMVRVLLKHGADPNLSRNDGFTPLLLAAFFGYEEVVKVLVEHGADTSSATRFGTSAKMWASARTFQDVVHYLNQPSTVRRFSKEAVVEQSTSQVQTGGKIPPVSGDDVVNSTTPAVALESLISKEGPVLLEPSTPTCEVTATNGLPDVQELVLRFDQRPNFKPWFQPFKKRRVVYSVTTSLVIVALIAGLTWQRQRRIKERGSKTHSTTVVTIPSAIENLGVAKIKTSSDAQGESLGEGNAAIDVDNHYVRPENATGENRSKPPLIVRSVISNSDSRGGKPSEEQNRVTNVKTPIPIPTAGSGDAHNRELPSVVTSLTKPQPSLPSVPASTAKPQPVPRLATPGNGPAPLTTQLISPSKSSPPKGRTIQWP